MFSWLTMEAKAAETGFVVGIKDEDSVRVDMDNINERMVEVMILSTPLYRQHTRLVVQSLPLVLWSGMPYCAFTGEEYLALG